MKPAASAATANCTLRRFRMEKSRGDAGPGELRTLKEWFQWAQTLVSSHSEKSTKFLGYWFLSINSYLLMFRLSGFCGKNFCISWLLSSSKQSLRDIWKAVFWGMSPQKTPWIKHNSQLLVQTKELSSSEPWGELGVCVQSCFSGVRLCDPTDCDLSGSSVHWILQARILIS